ncbi:MAG: hypothetical protein HY902_07715 [Deltaproteobacteria bacterium]|nr:hypothetical protein [Deltaproteobacteria bacterium]
MKFSPLPCRLAAFAAFAVGVSACDQGPAAVPSDTSANQLDAKLGEDLSAEDSASGSDGGTWEVSDAPTAAPDAEVDAITKCPSQPSYSMPLACTGSFSCTFGKECCCGICGASTQCHCTAGQFSCGATDLCFGAKCSPGCSMDQFQTPSGCKTCAAIGVALPAEISATLAPLRTCAADADCGTLQGADVCGWCSYGVALAQQATATQALAKMKKTWCTGPAGPCNLPCPESGQPACVQGVCHLVGLCDPLLGGPGTPCNDNNACTSGDVCSGPGKCAGKLVDCDDGNPCTQDTCSATGGCGHKPLSVPCPATLACSAGAQCMMGTCTDLGVKGWDASVTQLGIIPGTPRVRRLADGGVLYTSATGKQDQMYAVRLSAAGAVLLTTTVAAPVADAVAAAADGGFATTGFSYTKTWTNQKPNVLRWDASAKLLWTQELPLQGGMPSLLEALPSGGWLALGGYQPQMPNSWHTWLAVLEDSGKVAFTADLGPGAGYGKAAVAASKGSSHAVLQAVAGPSSTPGDSMGDVRWLRLDAAGKVVGEKQLSAGQGDTQPGGLVAHTQGWLAGVRGTVAGGATGKPSAFSLFLLDDNGAVLWSKAVASTAFGVVAAAPQPWLLHWTDKALSVQEIGAGGSLTDGLAVPSSLLITGSGLAYEPYGDGGLLLAGVQNMQARVRRVLPAGGMCP